MPHFLSCVWGYFSPSQQSAGNGQESFNVLHKVQDIEGLGEKMRSVELQQVFDFLGLFVADEDHRTIFAQLHVVDKTAEPVSVDTLGFGDDHVRERSCLDQQPDDIDCTGDQLGLFVLIGPDDVGEYFMTSTTGFQSVTKGLDGVGVVVVDENARHVGTSYVLIWQNKKTSQQ